jgi:hypothetical protein
MSERDGYQPGVPCGIAAAYPNPGDAARFYAVLADPQRAVFSVTTAPVP